MDISADRRLIERYYPGGRDRRLAGTRHCRESGYIDILRFFGSQRIDPSACTVAARSERFTLTDPVVRAHADRVANNLRAAGRLYDGPLVMKLRDLQFEPAALHCSVQPCTYADQAGSCFALDEPVDLSTSEATLRDYLHQHHLIGPVMQNPLAICFGVCGYLIGRRDARRWLLQINRAGHLSSFAGSPGPTVAGVVEFDPTIATLQQMLQTVLGRETTEELGLHPALFSIVPLAFAREIIRGERPQLFAAIQTDCSPEVVVRSLEQIPVHEREFSDPAFSDITGGIPAELFDRVNSEAAMNLLLLEEFLDGESTL